MCEQCSLTTWLAELNLVHFILDAEQVFNIKEYLSALYIFLIVCSGQKVGQGESRNIYLGLKKSFGQVGLQTNFSKFFFGEFASRVSVWGVICCDSQCEASQS